MLLAAGHGVANLIDYTLLYDRTTFECSSSQGDTLDTLNVTLHDPACSATLRAEDDLVALDERDPNGWPTVNLLKNPSFEGTYSGGGVAPSWATAQFVHAGTYSYAQNTSTARYGASSQQATWSGLSQGDWLHVYQYLALPTDETGATLAAQPYVFSAWYQVTAAAQNTNLVLLLNCYGAGGAGLGSVWSGNFALGAPSGWQRIFWRPTLPAGTQTINAVFQIITSNATNGGTVVLDGAQLEYATFGSVPLWLADILDVNLANTQFNGTAGSGVATSWSASGGASGVTDSLVNTPSLGSLAQQVAAASVAASTTLQGVTQALFIGVPLWNYQLVVDYQVTAALSPGASVMLTCAYADINQQPLTTRTAQSAAGLIADGQWHTLALSIGPAYQSVPSGAYYLLVSAGLYDATDATWNGTVVLGDCFLTPLFGNPDTATALSAQRYPTPYCDASQPGCYTDKRTGLAYRHWRLFGGFIKSADSDYAHGAERDIALQAVEYGTLLQEAQVTITLTQQGDQSAITAAGNYAVSLGYLVGLDYTTYVEAIGTIDSQSFAMGTFKDVLNSIANQTTAAYWVDPYMRLHYISALAQTAPYGLSDTPDLATTFPYTALHVISDSTQTATEEVIEGGPQTSAPQTYTASGVNTTLSAALTSGTQYSALSVATLSAAIPGGTVLTINPGGGSNQQVTVTTAGTAAGATSIPVAAFTANANYATATPVAVGATFTVYGGNAITLVDSVTAAGAALTVGLASNDTLGANGVTAVYAPDTGVITVLTALSASQSVTIIFRYSAPVLLRMQSSAASAAGGVVGRKIFIHNRYSKITSKQSAVDRGASDLATSGKPQPVVTCTVYSPQAPLAQLLIGQAIPFTHAPSGWSQTLLQVQQVKTHVLGNGVLTFDLQLGFFRPDAIILLAQSRKESATAGSNLAGNTILQEVLNVSDGWALTDSIAAQVSNVGTWDLTGSDWDGTTVWS